VHVDTAGAQDGSLIGEQDAARRLEEEEGLLGADVVQLLDVVGVVATNANDLGCESVL